MRRALRIAGSALVLLGSGSAASAQPGRYAQPPPGRRVPTETSSPPVIMPSAAEQTTTDLRARFGVEMAIRLLRSSDPDDRLRGLARAATVGSPEALALLVQSLEPQGVARSDARAMIEVARGLSSFIDQPSARNALLAIVSALPISARDAVARLEIDDAEQAPRMQLARETAALALSGSGDPRASDLLVPIARGGGPGQSAAALALSAFPPAQVGIITASAITQPAALRFLAGLGDLRTIDAVRSAVRANDPATRAAALLALGELGDARGAELARAAMGDGDPRVRVAGAEALIALSTPERFKAVEALLADDATALSGANLAQRAQNSAVVKALAARAVSSQLLPLRAAATAALGRSDDPEAVRTLVELLKYPLIRGDAADALARSPSPTATAAIEAIVLAPTADARRLGVRAYVVRVLVRGERSQTAQKIVEEMAESREVDTRSLGVFALVALGERDLARGLADREPQVRRAAALASLSSPGPETERTLLIARAREKDELTRQVLGVGLLGGDPEGRVTTTELVDRAEAGGPDSPLAAMSLARRTDAAHDAKVNLLLASRDPLIRAHAARGLGMSAAESATGRLAAAYAYEPIAEVRRAIVFALGARNGKGESSPSCRITLDLAARLDPDAQTRWVAGHGALGNTAPVRAGAVEVAWVRLLTVDGERPPSGMSGALVRADGLAVPAAFDDDGYALIPGSPPGESRLVLAPRLPAYEAPTP